MSNPTRLAEEKDKADVYLSLADSAQRRFDTHHSVEWKIHFGLWTFFVVGTAFVATHEGTPTWIVCVLSVLVVGLVGLYWLWWLPHSHYYREECTRSRWWWEMCAVEMIQDDMTKLPTGLRPEGWPLPSDYKGEWNKPRVKYEQFDAPFIRRIFRKKPVIHESHWMFVVVTLLFAGTFVLALWGARIGGGREPQAAQMTLVLQDLQWIFFKIDAL